MSSIKTIRALVTGIAFAMAVAAPLGLAVAAPDLTGSNIGKTADEITASLTSQGYEVKKVKPEDGLLEAYALKDGKRYEVYVDPATGKVAKVKEED